MKTSPSTIIETTLNELWRILVSVQHLDAEKAKQIIKEEVDYFINSK